MLLLTFLLLAVACGISSGTVFECKSSDRVANAYCADYCKSLPLGQHVAGSCAKDEVSCLCVESNNKTIKVRILQDQQPKPYQQVPVRPVPSQGSTRFSPSPQRLNCDGSPNANALCNSFCRDVIKGSQGICNTEDSSCRCRNVPFIQNAPIQAIYNLANVLPSPPQDHQQYNLNVRPQQQVANIPPISQYHSPLPGLPVTPNVQQQQRLPVAQQQQQQPFHSTHPAGQSPPLYRYHGTFQQQHQQQPQQHYPYNGFMQRPYNNYYYPPQQHQMLQQQQYGQQPQVIPESYSPQQQHEPSSPMQAEISTHPPPPSPQQDVTIVTNQQHQQQQEEKKQEATAHHDHVETTTQQPDSTTSVSTLVTPTESSPPAEQQKPISATRQLAHLGR